jgi:Na+/proline symporter
MAYLLRTLLLLMIVAVGLTVSTALGWINLKYTHIELAIPTIFYTIFAEAFVMFYFIGVSRLCGNVQEVLYSEKNLNELFDEAPSDLDPYKKKVEKYVHASTLSKRQTIPWTMLMLTLGIIGFLLGPAHHTGLVRKVVHSGVIYGFIMAMLIGFFRQWIYLGKNHRLLREMKALFSISDNAM